MPSTHKCSFKLVFKLVLCMHDALGHPAAYLAVGHSCGLAPMPAQVSFVSRQYHSCKSDQMQHILVLAVREL